MSRRIRESPRAISVETLTIDRDSILILDRGLLNSGTYYGVTQFVRLITFS
jgi:hypothetical protein